MAMGSYLEIPVADPDTCVSANRGNLQRFLDEFLVSLNLFGYLEINLPEPQRSQQLHDFHLITAKEGALCVYHFGCSLRAIKKNLPLSTFAKEVDPIRVRKIYGQFKLYFPNWENVRHVVAHAAELYKDPRSIKRNVMKEPPWLRGKFLISELDGRKFSIGHDGKLLSIDLSTNTTIRLSTLKNAIDNAFAASDAQTAPQYEN